MKFISWFNYFLFLLLNDVYLNFTPWNPTMDGLWAQLSKSFRHQSWALRKIEIGIAEYHLAPVSLSSE